MATNAVSKLVGVNGTPTFFINGVRHERSWELPSLLAALEHAGRERRAG